jgi:hypothetical protein
MANPVLFSNGYVGLASTTGVTAFTAGMNLSGIKSVAAPFSNAELANAVMGDTVEALYPGLTQAGITVVLRQDFTTGGATFPLFGNDKKMWTMWNARTPGTLQLRAVNSAGAVTNPKYTFTKVYISSITPINGAHGELLQNEVKFVLGGGTITRVTSST